MSQKYLAMKSYSNQHVSSRCFLREYASNIFKQHLDEKVSSSDNNSKEEEEFNHSSKKDSLTLCLVVPTLKISISSKKSPTSSQPIDRCLVQSGCSLTSRDGRGNSCLHWAAASHSSSAGKALAEMFLGQQEQ